MRKLKQTEMKAVSGGMITGSCEVPTIYFFDKGKPVEGSSWMIQAADCLMPYKGGDSSSSAVTLPAPSTSPAAPAKAG